MKIYVDADACPVKDIIISESMNAEIPVILTCSSRKRKKRKAYNVSYEN